MTFQDWYDVLTILTFAIVFMSLGAAVLHGLGEKRVARWLRLPYEEEDSGE